MSALLDLVREDLRGFAGYSSARRAAVTGSIWLNANESAWRNPADAGTDANRYPDPQPAELRGGECLRLLRRHGSPASRSRAPHPLALSDDHGGHGHHDLRHSAHPLRQTAARMALCAAGRPDRHLHADDVRSARIHEPGADGRGLHSDAADLSRICAALHRPEDTSRRAGCLGDRRPRRRQCERSHPCRVRLGPQGLFRWCHRHRNRP